MVQGEQLTPNLQLSRPLGPEGTSHVWVANHTGLGHEVVVKLLGRSLPRNSPQLHRFQREAEVAGHIKSPHVAHVLEHGVSSSGVPFLVTELLEGADLARRLRANGPLSLAEVGRLVMQLAQGLSKAHLLGLVHRNLTSRNVFLSKTADGPFDVKVLDVGMSMQADLGHGRVPTGAPQDSSLPEYASPEQVFGVKDVDFRADLWAIAIVAYEALTGRTPFRGKNLDEFTKAIEKGSFEAPSAIVSGVPAAIDAWFVKALQKDPAARFGGAKELADEFARAAGIEHHERLVRPSFLPNVPNQTSARTSIVGMPAPAISPDNVKVIEPTRNERMSSALLIAVIALVGIGTVLAGLSLLSSEKVEPHPPSSLHGR